MADGSRLLAEQIEEKSAGSGSSPRLHPHVNTTSLKHDQYMSFISGQILTNKRNG